MAELDLKRGIKISDDCTQMKDLVSGRLFDLEYLIEKKDYEEEPRGVGLDFFWGTVDSPEEIHLRESCFSKEKGLKGESNFLDIPFFLAEMDMRRAKYLTKEQVKDIGRMFLKCEERSWTAKELSQRRYFVGIPFSMIGAAGGIIFLPLEKVPEDNSAQGRVVKSFRTNVYYPVLKRIEKDRY